MRQENFGRMNTVTDMPDAKREPKSIRRLMSRFADKTSMVGVLYINNAKFWWAKLIWIVLLLIAVGVMTLQLWFLFDQFFKYPKQTKLSLAHDNLPFPEITICNTNVMVASRLNDYTQADYLKYLLEKVKASKAGRMRKRRQSDDGSQDENFTNNTDGLCKDCPEEEGYYDEEYDETATLYSMFYTLFTDIDRSDRAMLGHNISDMLMSCTFAGRQCTPEMFKLQRSNIYGNCWSLRNDKFKAKRSGRNYGFSIELNLEVSEYLKDIVEGYGARLQIHQPGTFIFPDEDGIYIPGFMETDIGIRLTKTERLGGKYGKCANSQEFQTKYNLTYSVRACELLCLVNEAVHTCQCYDSYDEEMSLKVNKSLRPCRSNKEISCLNSVYTNYDLDKNCNCVYPCTDFIYTKTTSQRQWPTMDYARELRDVVCGNGNYDPQVCDISTDIGEWRYNFLLLNIYFEDLSYETIKEEPEIELQQFLSDVGGTIGLWIGLSILSLCEVVQLLIELCGHGVHKSPKKRLTDDTKQYGHKDEYRCDKDLSSGSSVCKSNGIPGRHPYRNNHRASYPNISWENRSYDGLRRDRY